MVTETGWYGWPVEYMSMPSCCEIFVEPVPIRPKQLDGQRAVCRSLQSHAPSCTDRLCSCSSGERTRAREREGEGGTQETFVFGALEKMRGVFLFGQTDGELGQSGKIARRSPSWAGTLRGNCLCFIFHCGVAQTVRGCAGRAKARFPLAKWGEALCYHTPLSCVFGPRAGLTRRYAPHVVSSFFRKQ